jgi:hypothetical protein
VTGETTFVLTVTIGDNIYDLEGPRAELGAYRARLVPTRLTLLRQPISEHFELLTTDKKGKLVSFEYQIVGERPKKTEP